MKKTIFFLILSMLISFSANAQFCNKYADKAVSQYKLAKKNNLPGINWPLWTDDWNGHYNWCVTVSPDVANKEQAKRQAYLDKYLKGEKQSVQTDDTDTKGAINGTITGVLVESTDLGYLIGFKEKTCKHYAKRSVDQNNQNISLKCGFKPDLWNSDYDMHYNWCMHGENYLNADKTPD